MAYKEMWEIEVHHEGLNKYRYIKGSDEYIVKKKARNQKLLWDEMWKKKLLLEKKREKKELSAINKEKKKTLAQDRTKEATRKIDELNNILAHTLTENDVTDWDSLIEKKDFSEKKPKEPSYKSLPEEPKKSNEKYTLTENHLLNLIPYIKNKKIEENLKIYENNLHSWKESIDEITKKNKSLEEKYENNLKEWWKRKQLFNLNKAESNGKILKAKQEYFNKKPNAILDYCEMILSNSNYPDYFPQNWELEYNQKNKILIIDYSLPDIEDLPKVKAVKYIISRDEMSQTMISEAAAKKLYDNALYQIPLRTFHEIFEADVINSIDNIVFNGWVDSVDKATGLNKNSCIMSCQVSKDEFSAINLAKVDPKACFKQLKGIGSSKLHSLSPIAPIISIEKEDKRFVSGYDVADSLDESNNLAAMDWQDFENLIREIFEKEFSSNGGEVKITQASRDGGVDAIAFDPDPIRGGKIVIQAKRYTNVVGVSSVRDLYGTTMNEGATKGILVTTADYGPDAYEFAKGKPLTLLNGGNLLHLLDKHGHQAIIDITAAKKILSEK